MSVYPCSCCEKDVSEFWLIVVGKQNSVSVDDRLVKLRICNDCSERLERFLFQQEPHEQVK